MSYDYKVDERRCVERFPRTRRSATGETLTLVSDSEAPDFICSRSSGELLGIEHTRFLYNPEGQFSSDCDLESDNFEIAWDSAVAIAKKEAKRRKPSSVTYRLRHAPSYPQSGSDRLAGGPFLIATKYMLFRGQDTSCGHDCDRQQMSGHQNPIEESQ
jgi:hypothetical protein